MIRRAIIAILRITVRIFFRHIEMVGLDRIPRESSIIFVLNHPNGLVDPALVLSIFPRPVSLLAKAPLFRMPVIGLFVRALNSLPVYRHQDKGQDTARNRETFEKARLILLRGGTIAIFPEGVSHSSPNLLPLKTGTARIALGAKSIDSSLDLKIVPVGLYYTAKQTFRSSVLLYFGESIEVEETELDSNGEPPKDRVYELSNRIAEALKAITLNADHDEALATIKRAERIFSSEDNGIGGKSSLIRELDLQRRFVDGYTYHRIHSPEKLALLDARIRRYEEELTQLGLDPHDLSAPSYSLSTVARYTLFRTLLFIALFPFTVAGVALNYLPYRLVGHLATRFAKKQDDVISTFKMIASLLFFPLNWLILSLLVYSYYGWIEATVIFIFSSLTGYIAVRYLEEWDSAIGGAKALIFFITQGWFFKHLLVERRRIREEIIILGDEAERSKNGIENVENFS
jgi:glycerol-3-phosphate O-acyltransferase / dihydroxyacetone phosphate acyltransferase